MSNEKQPIKETAFSKYEKIAEETLNKFPELSLTQKAISDMASQIAKKEEKLLMDALSKHLNREATIEDVKVCQMVRSADTPLGCYFFFYQEVKLGYMEKSEMEWGSTNDLDFAENKTTVSMDIIFHPEKEEK